ncbi:MAG: hypothetical protein ACREOZ_00615, partial [Gloeomargaritales cyanobacterium]
LGLHDRETVAIKTVDKVIVLTAVAEVDAEAESIKVEVLVKVEVKVKVEADVLMVQVRGSRHISPATLAKKWDIMQIDAPIEAEM